MFYGVTGMNKRSKFEKYLTNEIGIEFKACLYFYTILFFHSMVLILQGTYSVSILTMAEMILAAYVICYIQMFVFHNFDESENLGGMELLGIVVCTGIYAVLSYLLKWFHRRIDITGYFALFMVFTYICVYYV
jgi:hypothetical protein